MVTRRELEALRNRYPDLPWPVCHRDRANSGPAHDLHRPALPRRGRTRDRDRGADADRERSRFEGVAAIATVIARTAGADPIRRDEENPR
jgi:hypothetical protein